MKLNNTIKLTKEQVFTNRLIEFEQTNNNDKFRQSKIDCKFSDGKVMSSWFYRNKDKILNGNDEVSLSIKKQYTVYKKFYGNSIATFEERLKEFEESTNLDKFKQTFCDVYFKDGTNMGTWFSRFDDKIREMKDDKRCISILIQHEKYLNLPKNWRAKKAFDNKKIVKGESL